MINNKPESSTKVIHESLGVDKEAKAKERRLLLGDDLSLAEHVWITKPRMMSEFIHVQESGDKSTLCPPANRKK